MQLLLPRGLAATGTIMLTVAIYESTSPIAAVADNPLTVHVNVSGLELAKPGYVDDVDRVLADTGWSPSQLVLEVTESVLDLDTRTTTAALHELRARGIRIAIDDFGTGYSSLGRIQTLPPDFLKLDRRLRRYCGP